MSGGILRFPWTSQPQTPVGVDPKWGGPALKMLLVQSGGSVRDIVNPSIVWTPNNNATTKATPKGIAASFDGVDDYFSASGYQGITGAKGTFFMWVPRIGALDSYGTVWFGTNTGSIAAFQSAGDTAYCFGAASFTAGTITSVANSSDNSLVFTADTAINTQRYYRNGLPEGTPNSTTPTAFAAGSKNFNFGRYIGGSTWDADADIVIAGFTTDVWTQAQAKAFHDNPWQLFAPIQRTIWVPAAAGGGATYTLTADSGSFALTGQTAGLAFNRVLAADTQSFSLTGQTTGLAFNRTLSAASGSFALTGQDAGLAFNRVLSAENGSYALGGQDVTLTYTPISGATYTLTAASGSFALTGQDTVLAFNRVLTADTQSYSLSGDFAGLAFNRVLTANTVSYALTGQDVTLTYTGNTYTLNAESGTFFVDGQDANLVYSGGSSADTGDGSMSRKRYYLRRKGKILLFDTAAQADDYLEAEEEAQKAIATAKSRGAKKRIAAKILKAVEPVESVEIAPLQELVKAYSVPVNLPQLLSQQDYSQVMDVRAMIQRIQDDEDDELLLLLA